MYAVVKKAIVYGSIKQMRDLQYVFPEVSVEAYSDDPEDIIQYVANRGYAILCKSQKPDISARLSAEQYCWDEGLIHSLNFSLKQRSGNKKVVIWGTGNVCSWFEREYKNEENIDFFGYIDSDQTKWGNKRKGMKILSPAEISPKEYYVIVATNHENFMEIEKELKDAGFTDEYIYYRRLFEDLAAFFRKTYECNVQFPEIECPNKDRCVRIKSNGDVCTCCIAYDSIYGNLFEQEFEEIWHSRRARIGRLALENRTYVNCDQGRCPFLINREPEAVSNEKQEKWQYEENHMDYPDSIAPEVDISCNLYCRSCRNEIFIDDNPYLRRYADLVVEKLVHLPSRLLINTVGELFVSKSCKYILYHEKTRKRKAISIYTNGTMLSPDVLDEVLQIYETIELSISIDAATKATYEKLRRNGKFDVLCRNLSYISKKRKENRVSYLQFNYVLQMENIEEMDAFIKFAKESGCDMITINGIEPWGHMTDDEYRKSSVVEERKLKTGLEKYFTDELIKDEEINFLNIANIIGAKPRFMYTI